MGLSRSEQMGRIKGKNTKPEVRLRKALWAEGVRYRLHVKTPAGRPDVVFPGPKVAVFIDGCFWHGCPKHYSRPGSREEFWATKLRDNVERDRRQTRQLEESGWTVVRVWEHAIYEELEDVVARVRAALAREGGGLRDDWRVVRVDVVDAEARIERRVEERLRAPGERRESTGRRVTAKWKRPKG